MRIHLSFPFHKTTFWQRLNVSVSPLVIVAGLIILGLSIRAYHVTAYPFGFDQVQLVTNAESILHGHLTLIGPRTGYANMFVGPAMYYLLALVTAIISNLYALVVLSLLIAGLTGLAIYWLAKSYLNKNTAFIMLLLWAVSPFLVRLDRVPWNPNLALLAASLVFIPLVSNQIEAHRSSFFLILLGCFLGFQAHLSGLFLPILAMILGFLFYSKKIALFQITLPAIIGTLISLLPEVLFDWRHDWLNARGFYQLLFMSHSRSTVLGNIIEMLKNSRTTVETFGKQFFEYSHPVLIYSTGALIILLLLKKLLLTRDQSTAAGFIWLIGIIILYGFYPGPKPEYYFLIELPAIFYLLAQLIQTYLPNQSGPSLVIYSVYTFILSLIVLSPTTGLTLGNIITVNHYVRNLQSKTGVAKITYDLKLGDDVGIKYLLADLSTTPTGSHIHISYPQTVPYESVRQFGDISIWQDYRDHLLSITKPNYYFTYPNSLSIYQQYPLTPYSPNTDTYLLNQNQSLIGRLSITPRTDLPDVYDSDQKLCSRLKQCGSKFTSIQNTNQAFILKRDLLISFTANVNQPVVTLLPTLDQIKFY